MGEELGLLALEIGHDGSCEYWSAFVRGVCFSFFCIGLSVTVDMLEFKYLVLSLALPCETTATEIPRWETCPKIVTLARGPEIHLQLVQKNGERKREQEYETKARSPGGVGTNLVTAYFCSYVHK